MKTLREACETGEFILSVEAPPPKGGDAELFSARARLLLGKVHAVNVTDNQAAVMRASSLAVSKLLLDMGHDSVYQIAGRDRNRLGIQSDLLGAHLLGIRNVLSLTGDYVTVGDQKESKPVFDLESVQILKVITGLNAGVDMVGRPLKGATNLFAGSTVTPDTRPFAPLAIKFEKKVAAGARFFQTQAVFDVERFADFMTFARRFDVKIIAGILLLRSAKMARFVTTNLPGISVPAALIARLEKAGAAGGAVGEVEAGLEMTVETIAAVRPLCDGVHLMAIGAEERIPEILLRAGLTPAGHSPEHRHG